MPRKTTWLEQPLIPSLDELRPDGARVILSMRLSPAVIDRADELSKATKRRRLTEPERGELEFLLNLGSLLTIMHSKARMALKRAQARVPRRKSA